MLERTFSDEHRGRAGHINIQHYAQLISDATDRLIDQVGLADQTPIIARKEAVRFLGELHSGDKVEVIGGIAEHSRERTMIVGTLRRTRDARVVSEFRREVAPWSFHEERTSTWNKAPIVDAVASPPEISPIQADFVSPQLNNYQVTVNSSDVDELQTITPRALWHVITEALWEAQTKLGAGQAVQRERGIGGGATVFHLETEKPITRGTLLSVNTSAIYASESSVGMEHEMRNANNENELFLRARYVVTFFERDTGRRCPLARVFPDVSFEAMS